MNIRRSDTGSGIIVRRPVILLTPDSSEQDGGSAERHYVLRANFAEAIAEAGGLPLILPFESQQIVSAVHIADGIVITGS